MKLIKSLAAVSVVLVAQVVFQQHSAHYQIGVRLADIDRQLLGNPPERRQLQLEKANLLERTGHLENALRAYLEAGSPPEQIAALSQKIEQQRQQLVRDRAAPRLFAVLIGISNYHVASLPRLPSADGDAVAFASFLRSDRRTAANPSLFTLIGNNAREAAIRAALEAVLGAQARPEDTVYIYLAAHGLTEPAPAQRAFLIASDTHPWEKTAAGYAFSNLIDLLRKNPSRPRSVLLIGDLCQTKTFQGRENDVNRVLEQQLGSSNPYLQVILAGCPEPGTAMPPSNLGLFTHHVLEGLGRSADRNGDRQITSNELFDHVREQMGLATKWRSEVVRFGARLDIPLSRIPGAAGTGSRLQERLGTFWLPREPSAAYGLLASSSPFLAQAQVTSPAGQPTLAQQTFAEGQSAFELAVAAEDLGQQVILNYLLGEDSPQTQADFDRGREFFKLANDLNPAAQLRAREAFCLGRSLIFQRRFLEATSHLEQTISIEPDAAYAWNALGIAQLEQTQFSAAADRFRQAILYAPTWPYPRNNLALALTELGRYREAESEFRLAIARAPQSAYLRYNLGVLLHRRNRLEEARRIYDQLIAEQPGLPQPYIARGALWATAGDFDRAVQEYEVALTLDKASAAARHSLGLAYSHQGKLDRAQQAWSENTALNPQFAPSRVCVAETYEKRGDWARAADEYAAILRRDKELVAARIALAEALRRSGKSTEAEAQLRIAANQAPAYWLIDERLGDLLLERGSPEARDQYLNARAKAFEKSDRKRLKNKIDNVTNGTRFVPPLKSAQEKLQPKTSCFP
jgi:tetratricopeptide (TPR) repeat protein